MKGLIVPGVALLMAATFMPAPPLVAQTPTRLSDKDVKALIETLDKGRDRFQGELDGKVKSSVVREPSLEVRVDKYLDDFKDSVEHLKDRFEPKYAAGAEAATVIRQATAIDTFMKKQPANLKGMSEWQHLAVELNRLADVYGTTFPLGSDSSARPVRRINDGEAAAAAAKIEEEAEHVKDAVGNEKTLAEPAKKRLKEAAELVKQKADKLKSRLKDSEPATAEATLLFAAIRDLDSASKDLNLSPASLTPMGALRAPLDTLRQAFRTM
jgi:hypothetical protein